MRSLVDANHPDPESVIVMADDSGLEIDFLDKAPGIMSARFMGHDSSYDVKNNELLSLLQRKGLQNKFAAVFFLEAVESFFPAIQRKDRIRQRLEFNFLLFQELDLFSISVKEFKEGGAGAGRSLATEQTEVGE